MSLGSLMPIRDKGKTSKANERIDTFQSLRFVAIMMIVLHHVNFMYQDGSSFLPGGGPAGVSFFVLLSGFVLTYAWRERPFAFPLSLRAHAVWLWSRIRKFYFLHLLTFCLAAPMTCYGLWKSQEWGLGIAETMANLLLVQSLVPVKDVYFSYNAVSWYLSDTMWFYLCLPACLYLFRKWHRSKMALLTGIFMLQIIYNWICLGSPYEHWLLYINPLYRLTDFLIGGCVCLMAMDNRGGQTDIQCTLLEGGSLLILVAAFAIYPYVPHGLTLQLYWVPCMALLLYAFAPQRGILSGLLLQPGLVHLGNISLEIFLLHQVILRYAGYGASKVMGFSLADSPCLALGVLLVVIIGCSEMYSRMARCIQK